MNLITKIALTWTLTGGIMLALAIFTESLQTHDWRRPRWMDGVGGLGIILATLGLVVLGFTGIWIGFV